MSTLDENIKCVITDEYVRSYNEADYCLLYYPSRTWNYTCPFLETKSMQVRLRGGWGITYLDYWKCKMNEHTNETRRKVVRFLRQKKRREEL